MGVDVVTTSAARDTAMQSALAAAWQTLSCFGVPPRQHDDVFSYFKSLDHVLTGLSESGGVQVVEATMTHIEYLAGKSGCSAPVILGGWHFNADPRVMLDTLTNISDELRTALGKPARDPADAAADPAVQRALAEAWQALSPFQRQLPQSTDLFAFFSSLKQVLPALADAGEVRAVDRAMTHIQYLAGKADCDSAFILEGRTFTADPPVVLDTLANIADSLRAASQQHTNPLDVVPADLVSSAAEPGPALRCALAFGWQTLSGHGLPLPQSTDLAAYFRALDSVLIALNESGRIDPAETAMTHVRYLASKAGCVPAEILGGGHFTASLKIILEALANISTALQDASVARSEPPPEDVPADVFALIVQAEATLTGWCSREKALVIARTVLQERPVTCVEIGIFGGRSLVPCAAALRHLGAGAIYGIEAWSPQVAVENATNEGNDEWWSNIDFAAIKRAFYRFVAATNLTQQVRVIEAPSGRAAALFDQIDFLHIDGSHSMLNAAEDVILYARKVRPGGIVVFDDVNWQSTAPARDLLAALCDTVTVLKDPATGLDICAVLRRR